jgi:hypothetical protein
LASRPVSEWCSKLAAVGDIVNVKLLVIKLREGAKPVRMSARKNASLQLKFMRYKVRELEELSLV